MVCALDFAQLTESERFLVAGKSAPQAVPFTACVDFTAQIDLPECSPADADTPGIEPVSPAAFRGLSWK
jgi:hypothetical protein